MVTYEDYATVARFQPYGYCYRCRIGKRILRSLWIVVFVALPFVTPLAAMAKRIFRRDVLITYRYEVEK